MGVRFESEQVSDINRNGCPVCVGIRKTPMIKAYINGFRPFADDPENKAAIEGFRAMLLKKRAVFAKAIDAAMTPVQHTIIVAKAE